MKVKQKNVRVFDIYIESEQEFFEYFEKNLIILKEYFLFLTGEVTLKIEEYLNEHGVCFKNVNGCNIKSLQKNGNSSYLIEQNIQNISTVQEQHSVVTKEIKPKIINKPLRSGEEIVYDGNVIVFGRVNSGAKIISNGNVEVFGTVDGMIQCDGEYMILKEVKKGHIIFNGDILDNKEFDDNLKKVLKQGDSYVIKDIF